MKGKPKSVYRIELQIPYGTLIDVRETYTEGSALRYFRKFLKHPGRIGMSGFIPILLNGVEVEPHTLKATQTKRPTK